MVYKILRFSLLVLAILLISRIASQYFSFAAISQWGIDEYTRANGIRGILQYLLASVILLSLGLPRQLVAFMGGYAFGVAEGILYSTLAAIFSCAIVMTVSRYLARPVAMHFFKSRVSQLDSFLLQSPLLKSIIIRLLPVGNNLLTNVLAGLSNISYRGFLLGSAIGYIPQMAVFALMGKGILVDSELKLIISIGLFSLSSALSAYLYKQYRHQQGEQATPIYTEQKN
ncbi:TVP38/TMEM64 family protein [Alteromonas sp. 14N.309.X.WAT.G.H12]|uniref:TVP38/TMEM64 family protein n=1 Tax=Alteromonas sp. 14N.309.X.WAT.G.H12 TaxID=3120824 RepID=UPI002FD027EF